MIGRLKGVLDTDDSVIDVNGIGYQVNYTGSVSDSEEHTFYIETIVRENAVTLWAFDKKSDKDAFQALMKVQKVGPSVAGNIIKTIGADGAFSGDVDLISTTPRVGKKLAENIVAGIKVPAGFTQSGFSEKAAVRESLEALGYTTSQINAAIDKADLTDKTTLSEAINIIIPIIND